MKKLIIICLIYANAYSQSINSLSNNIKRFLKQKIHEKFELSVSKETVNDLIGHSNWGSNRIIQIFNSHPNFELSVSEKTINDLIGYSKDWDSNKIETTITKALNFQSTAKISHYFNKTSVFENYKDKLSNLIFRRYSDLEISLLQAFQDQKKLDRSKLTTLSRLKKDAQELINLKYILPILTISGLALNFYLISNLKKPSIKPNITTQVLLGIPNAHHDLLYKLKKDNIKIADTVLHNNSTVYDVLGVKNNSEPQDIKKAYLKLSRKWHTDRPINSISPNTQKEIFQLINYSWDRIKKYNGI